MDQSVFANQSSSINNQASPNPPTPPEANPSTSPPSAAPPIHEISSPVPSVTQPQTALPDPLASPELQNPVTTTSQQIPPPTHKTNKKLPFMVVTIVLFLILGGYGASFMFLRLNPFSTNTFTLPVLTPLASEEEIVEPTTVEPTFDASSFYATQSGKGENPPVTPDDASLENLEGENFPVETETAVEE